ncbi:Carboxymuconolactone decarboxylase family protein OS=Streptomyces rimosus subsp. rimosus (strain ATCC / DSM 40260 / JCM 4667 / NRRL 2234) OX=1265868 GN=SRIM_038715 PE=4 SV=1 [Streptomyces rimosus subsp. rimosus]
MDARFNLFENEFAAKFTKRFANAGLLIAQSALPKATEELVALRVSQINGCGWCVDAHAKEAAAAGETRGTAQPDRRVARGHRVHRGRAGRAGPGRGGRLADAHQGVSDETWDQVRKHYDDDQVAALVTSVAMVNAANRLAVIVHQKGGSYEPGMFANHLSN